MSELEAALAVLAPFKRPVVFHRVPALPRNAMGKVQKAALRTRYSRATVRVATLDDVDFLVAGNLALAKDTEDLTLDPLVVRSGVERAIAEGHGQRVGQLLITTEWSDWRAKPVWWIHSVFVLPTARRQGIFTTLFDHVRQESLGAGAGGLRLYVDRTNHQAVAVYEQLGMTGDHYDLYEWMHVTP